MTDESDVVKDRVRVMLTQARANFEHQCAGLSADEREALRQRGADADLDDGTESRTQCPACAGLGIASGNTFIDWDFEHLIPGSHWPQGTMWFEAWEFSCGTCGLHLNDPAELNAAGIPDRWTQDFDPKTLILEIDEPVAYEVHRNKLQGRVG